MYRKITVNGTVYEYVVGKTHVKVKGLDIWPKEAVGKTVTVPQYCECCGEPMAGLYSSHVDPTRLAVTPRDVAQKIKAAIGWTVQDTFDALVEKG
jgi:hypothetical protein